jgi:DNA polymerase-3 subunit chi
LTEVDFHTGVTEPVDYLCRLLRKAAGRGARVLVRAPEAGLDLLDRALWVFDPQAFVAHLRLVEGRVPAPTLHRTPVWLVPPSLPWPVELPPCNTLVRWQCQPDADLGDWLRVIEVVSDDPAERAMARQQWRACEARGLAVRHHAVPAAG